MLNFNLAEPLVVKIEVYDIYKQLITFLDQVAELDVVVHSGPIRLVELPTVFVNNGTASLSIALSTADNATDDELMTGITGSMNFSIHSEAANYLQVRYHPKRVVCLLMYCGSL